jgi:hypothetical protein
MRSILPPRGRFLPATMLTVIVTTLAVASLAPAETVIVNEDFLTRAQADTVLTTAAWDTLAGQLHLFAQGLVTRGAVAVTGQAYAAAWQDDHLLLASGSDNVLLVIATDPPTDPAIVKTHPLPANARHVTVAADWAYVSLGSGLGLQTVNVSDVLLPVNGARVDLDGFTGQTVVAANWAYSACYNSGVGVVEITDPANPVKLPSVVLDNWVRWVEVQGNYLYLAADNTLTVMDRTVPASPDSVAGVTVSGTAYCVTIADTWAYVGGPAGLDIVDIASPTAPQLFRSLSLGGGAAYHIAVQGDSLFVANGNNGLNIVDISNIAQPQVVANRFAPDYFYHVLLQNDLVWASNGGGGLLVMEADPTGLDPNRNVALSNNLNPAGDPVIRVRLAADFADSIRFDVSGNGGSSWQPIAPDDSWLAFDPQGSDLRWRATLVQTGPAPGPVCNSLQLTFERLQSAASITAVTDVPHDAGRQVRLSWDASRFDAAAQQYLVDEYSVYRRYDPTQQAAKAYPPGDWEYLLTVPADQEATYSASVPTLADSSGQGPNWAVFFVRARTTVAGIYFDSAPDSGYSVNNLAPAPPTGLIVARGVGGVQLEWDPSVDPDFAHFRLYRVPSPSTQPSPGSLHHVTTGTSFYDATDELWFYQLTQVNLAGLESAPSPHATAVGNEPDRGRFLGQNTPNPFNPTTRIAFAVPTGGRDVQLAVYDLRGHRVAILHEGFLAGGRHVADWNGRDQQDRNVASGRYSCRLRCGNRTTTLPMVLVR